MTKSIGQRLKQAREAHRQTIDQVSQITRIRPRYLEALEADDFSNMPSAVQGRGFLRIYAQFLGLDIERILEEMRHEQAAAAAAVFHKVGEPVENINEVDETGGIETDETTGRSKAKPEGLTARRRWLDQDRSERSVDSAAGSDISPVGGPEQDINTKGVKVPESAGVEQTDMPVEMVESEAFWIHWLQSVQGLLSSLKNIVKISRSAVSKMVTRSRSHFERSAEIEPGFGQDMDVNIEPEVPLRSAQRIFVEIGQQLRQRREMLNLTFVEIEQHIHIRPQYLQGLEAGDITQLPSPVQVRRILNNYAVFLGLEVDDLLLHFADGLQIQRLERYPPKPGKTSDLLPKSSRRTSLRSFMAPDLIFGIGVFVLLLTVTIWGGSRIVAKLSESTPESTARSISDVLIFSPIPTVEMAESPQVVIGATPLPIEGTQTPIGSTQEGAARIQVNIVAVQRSWVRVIVDGKIKFEGRVLIGNAYPFDGDKQIEVLTGNAAALRITYNMQELGLMGSFGEVVDRIYTLDGIITPTATSTSTGTSTPRASPTPIGTPTPYPSATATGIP